MNLPGKFTPFNRSLLRQLPSVLDAANECQTLAELRQKTKATLPSHGELMSAVCILHVLGRLSVDMESGALIHD